MNVELYECVCVCVHFVRMVFVILHNVEAKMWRWHRIWCSEAHSEYFTHSDSHTHHLRSICSDVVWRIWTELNARSRIHSRTLNYITIPGANKQPSFCEALKSRSDARTHTRTQVHNRVFISNELSAIHLFGFASIWKRREFALFGIQGMELSMHHLMNFQETS